MDIQVKIDYIKDQIKVIESRMESDKVALALLKKAGRSYSKLMEKAKDIDTKEILSRNQSEHESPEMAKYLSGLPPTMIE